MTRLFFLAKNGADDTSYAPLTLEKNKGLRAGPFFVGQAIGWT